MRARFYRLAASLAGLIALIAALGADRKWR